jgi:hypothetical protein
VRELRRHEQVLAGDLEVQLAHELEVLEVAIGDEADRDLEDVELVLLDQVQEQVERPLEIGKRDADRIRPLRHRLGGVVSLGRLGHQRTQ